MGEWTQIVPDVYRLKIPFEDIYTTVFIVKTEQGTAILDTATYPEDMDTYLVPALQALGIAAEEVKYVVVSHNHRDHAGGLGRFVQLFPGAVVAAGSTACGGRIPGREVLVLQEGDTLLGVLRTVTLPGHTADCIGLLDTRTGTLLSGDGLQQFGIYGSGPWGANISYIKEHLALGPKLNGLGIRAIAAAHDYHPWGWWAEGADVPRTLAACADALVTLGKFVLPRTDMDAEDLAAQYNGTSGLPRVGAHVFTAVQKALAAGELQTGGNHMKTAYFAGGCFWCITPTFKEMDGVLDVISGYSGGDEADPTYKEVKTQKTGHRETIRIDYDPEKVSFEELFEVFLNGVDPFDDGGQFIDRGHSYTLAVYFLTEDERLHAEKRIREVEEQTGQKVYIALEAFKSFYNAEEEHQDYYLKHPAEFEQELIESGRKQREQ